MMRYGKEEFLEILDNGLTVGEVINYLQRYDPEMLVVNTRSNEFLPVTSVEATQIDYCFDEIIKKDVVSIY